MIDAKNFHALRRFSAEKMQKLNLLSAGLDPAARSLTLATTMGAQGSDFARIEESGRPVLKLTGHFDAPAARNLCERLAREEAEEVVVDFSAVEALEDHSLRMLAEEVQRARCRVKLRGLREHHLRLLAYLGVPPGRVSESGA